MSIVVHFGRRIFGILQWIIASIRRLFCCWRKRIYESDLPFLASSRSNKDGAFLENWDSWDNKTKPKSLVQTQIEEYRQRLSTELKAPPVPDVEPSNEPDIFIDMEPEYKKSKKILLKPKNTPQSTTNKFAVQNDLAIVDTFNTRELDVLDDYESADQGVNWDVEESLDVDSVLKEAKMKERLERVEKHRQKKSDKEKQRWQKENR